MPEDRWPFSAWLRVAVRHLGISPQMFWAMSVSDWLIILETEKHLSLTRQDLQNLCEKFPDCETNI